MKTPEKNIELKRKIKEANSFILDIAKILKIDTDGIGFDGLQLSIDDFKEAQKEVYNQAIDDAVKNAKVIWIGEEGNEDAEVDKQSILKLKK